MNIRHISHVDLSLAAIDNIIEKGDWYAWMRLARAIRDNAAVAEKVGKRTTWQVNNIPDDDLYGRRLFARWQALCARQCTNHGVR